MRSRRASCCCAMVNTLIQHFFSSSRLLMVFLALRNLSKEVSEPVDNVVVCKSSW